MCSRFNVSGVQEGLTLLSCLSRTHLVLAGAAGDGGSAFKIASSLTCGESWCSMELLSLHVAFIPVSPWSLGFVRLVVSG